MRGRGTRRYVNWEEREREIGEGTSASVVLVVQLEEDKDERVAFPERERSEETSASAVLVVPLEKDKDERLAFQ